MLAGFTFVNSTGTAAWSEALKGCGPEEATNQ
jgi:hypothetical protein